LIAQTLGNTGGEERSGADAVIWVKALARVFCARPHKRMATMDNLSRHRSFESDADLEQEDAGAKRRREKEAAKAAHKERLDDKLDQALEESFPGSDPISIVQPPQSPYDKPKH
jgi:hypothetical protein